MSAEFVKRWLHDFESMHFIYRSSKNERFDEAKTRAPPALVFLLFLFKRGDDRASRLCKRDKGVHHSVGRSLLLGCGALYGGEVPHLCQ